MQNTSRSENYEELDYESHEAVSGKRISSLRLRPEFTATYPLLGDKDCECLTCPVEQYHYTDELNFNADDDSNIPSFEELFANADGELPDNSDEYMTIVHLLKEKLQILIKDAKEAFVKLTADTKRPVEVMQIYRPSPYRYML